MDEYGELAGVITVEDLLEEIVGNIYDEFDPAEPPELEQLGEDLWRVQRRAQRGGPGRRRWGSSCPRTWITTRWAEWCSAACAPFPRTAAAPWFRVNGLDLQVEKVADHRIQSVLVRKAAPQAPGEGQPPSQRF